MGPYNLGAVLHEECDGTPMLTCKRTVLCCATCFHVPSGWVLRMMAAMATVFERRVPGHITAVCVDGAW